MKYKKNKNNVISLDCTCLWQLGCHKAWQNKQTNSQPASQPISCKSYHSLVHLTNIAKKNCGCCCCYLQH